MATQKKKRIYNPVTGKYYEVRQRSNADGTGQTRLTNNAASDVSPTWSPDGTRMHS